MFCEKVFRYGTIIIAAFFLFTVCVIATQAQSSSGEIPGPAAILYSPTGAIDEIPVEVEVLPVVTEMVVDESFNGQIIRAEEASFIRIQLESNPSTGYQWQIEIDESMLELIDNYFELSSDLIGAPGTEIFLLEAIIQGETTIRLTYSRPWETDVPPLKEIIYHVIIEPAARPTPLPVDDLSGGEPIENGSPVDLELPSYDADMIIDESFDDQTISLENENILHIMLESNPTTGYGWEIEVDESILPLLDSYFAPSSELIGAGGIESFILQSVAPGETTITLKYRRPWETDVAPLDEITFYVIIEAAKVSNDIGAWIDYDTSKFIEIATPTTFTTAPVSLPFANFGYNFYPSYWFPTIWKYPSLFPIPLF